MPNIANVNKELLPQHASPNIHQKRQNTSKLESMDRETATTSKIAAQASGQKRLTSNVNSYVMGQNCEISSEGGMYLNGLPSTNNYTTAGQGSRGGGVGVGGIPHTLGNTLA